MIAFTVAGWPIYRYGIFYLITFLVGYAFLWYVGRTGVFRSYTGIQQLFTTKRDDLVLVVMVGVLLGGRLGHVVIYDLNYYLAHPGEILAFWQGGMSFVGGVIGVIVGIIWLARYLRLTKKELFLLGDIILCIVPLGSMLGRIGNYLNQELRGVPIHELSSQAAQFFKTVGLVHVYDTVDLQPRVNTNILQSIGEGLLPLLLTWSIFFGSYLRKHIYPGTITGVFFMLYGSVRFFVEFFKDLPPGEMWGLLSASQWIMLAFIGFGVYCLEYAQRE